MCYGYLTACVRSTV
ncbi:hypothetical protein F383_01177 [Gossypium arboreum]|uniref:Uncharacterized protein n=1 Tax=Gossypium arboreum TaxID=29729 RepID=A0A0B0NNK9_GOSAR|nr:hypothetical protein F383_01177 [Gossypium arboreum]